MAVRRAIAGLRLAGLVVLAGAVLCGCATPPLEASRHNFYAGRFDRAEKSLEGAKVLEKDKVLYLMERGMVRHAAGQYEESSKDFIEASDWIDRFETYSVSKGASSMVANDTVQDYRGSPYERTLLHCFTAINHLALARWDEAAVEARRIIKALDPAVRGTYPEDAFSRYMAGFCLEMIDDDSNAAIQYRQAASIRSDLAIDENSGIVELNPGTNEPAPKASAPARKDEAELVCFVFLGRSSQAGDRWAADQYSAATAYAEIRLGDQVLGRSFSLADTVELAFTTEQIEAARKVAKTVGRVVLKEVIAESVASSTDNKALGELVRFILIGILEQPDIRRWETLPRWLGVARVRCPAGLTGFDVVFFNQAGDLVRTLRVDHPISRRRGTYVSFCRDTPTIPQQTTVQQEPPP